MEVISTPLWQMRTLQNWIKTVMIKELTHENCSCVQIGQAHLDIGKWYAFFLISLNWLIRVGKEIKRLV